MIPSLNLDDVPPIRVEGTLVHVPRDRYLYAMSVVSMKSARYAELAGTKARRVLDLCAGAGEFALHAAKRWPGCWIDAFEPNPALLALLVLNAPAGTIILFKPPDDFAPYDVVRLPIGMEANGRVVAPHAHIIIEENDRPTISRAPEHVR